MEEEQKFCKNCKRNVAAVNFVLHIAYCERKIQLCQLCGEPVPRSEAEFDAHLKEYHILEECNFCKLPIEKWKLDSHQADKCYKRLVNCKYCDLSCTFDTISEHEESCGSRTDECSFCKARFLLKEMEAHLGVCPKNNVLKTQMLCSYCESKFPVENYGDHVRSCVFRSEECLKCRDRVKLKDLKEHGDFCGKENHRQSSYFCEHCEQKFSWKEFQSHQLYCRARFKICRQCHESVQMSELDHHLEICQKVRRRESEPSCQHCGRNFPFNILKKHETSCELRPEKCPYCHDFVTYKNMKMHMEVCGQVRKRESEPSCQHCEKHFPSNILENHETSCGFRPEKCPNCYEVVSYKDMKKHMEVCGQIGKRESEPSCQHCEKSFPSNVLENHETSCGFRSAKCPNCYDVVAYKDRRKHMEICGQIGKRESEPSCQHCKKSFPSNVLENHETSCGFRSAKCPNCYDVVAYKDRKKHMEICGQIGKRESEPSCQHCKKSFPSNVLENHETSCGFRSAKCPNCYDVVAYKDMKRHMEVCGEALRNESELCEHCGKTFPSNILENHKSNCDLRCEKCAFCYEYVKYKDLEHHKELCGQVKQYLVATCKDCDRRIPTEMMEEHQSTCDFQKCPLCNNSVEIKDMDIHLNTCEQTRKYPKATCEHCSSKIPVNKLADHESNCDFHCKTCPLCNVAVKVKDMDNHQSICEQKQKCQSKVECEHCGIKFPFKHIEEHELSCGFRLEKCSLCYDFIELIEMDGHRRTCEKINLPQMPTTCPYCELEFPSNEIEYHIVSCGASLKKCFTCERMFKLRNFNEHECLKNNYEIQGEDLTKNDHIEQAIEIKSDDRPLPCEYCFETFPLNCLSLHMETCQDLSEKCQFCDTSVKFKDRYKHKETCMKPCDRLTMCPFCRVKFRSESLLTHLETCTERIENCKNCDLPVMLRDKRKHMESCKQESAKEECGICSLLVPKDELSEHFSKCVVENSNNPYSECGMSTPRPIASCTDDSKVKMHTEGTKTNLYPSIGDLLLCPYCSMNFLPKRFDNHKKYCKSALVECPICQDIYHIEEKEEHRKTCDALDSVLIPESDLKLELQNKFGTLRSEENLREKEALYEQCPFCENKIPERSYSKHLLTCSLSMKQCLLCKQDFPKGSERDHFTVCPKLIKMSSKSGQDEFVYGGFSPSDSKTKDFHEVTLKCNGCKKYIPTGGMDSHLTQCKSKVCPYCDKSMKGNPQTHLTKCNDYKKRQQKSLNNQNTGAKPKNKNSEESGALNRFTGAVKSFFYGSEKTNPSHSMDSQTNLYSAAANYNENLVAPPDEIMYVSCEFCGKDIIMDQEVIAMHESGCRPDLVSLPSAVSDEHRLHKSAHEAYSYSDQASALQRERRYLEKPEDKKVTPDDVSCEADTYNFMKNFRNKYDTQDTSYQENLEVEATKGNLGSEINDIGRSCDKYIVEDANTWDCKESRSMSKCLEKKYESKYSTIESNDEYPENVLGSQENNEIKEDSDVYEARSYLRRSKMSTEPGEFLKNNLDCKQFDLRSSKKRGKLSSDFTDNSDVRNKDKLYNSWQEIDARRAETHYKNNHNERDKPIHNNRKKVVSTEGRKSEQIANQTSLNIRENVGVIGAKSSSNKVMNKNASPYSDNYHHDSDPESSKEDNSDYKNKSMIHSGRKNVTSSKSDKHTSKSYSSKDCKKDLNAFHSTYSSTKVLDENISADDPLYDSDPESCKEMKDSNAYDYSYIKNKAERIELDTESGKHSNQDVFKSEASIIFSSEMKGPVKIDRLRRRAEGKVNEYSEHFERNKQLTDCHAKESLYPDVSSFSSGDTFEKSSQEKLNDMYLKGRQRSAKAGIDNDVLKSTDTYEKGSNERLYDMYLKESQQTTKADINHMFKNSSYKQYFESNAKKDEPMETDDENNIVGKHTSIPTDYFPHSRMYADVSDFETKDSNMDSYFEFLRNEKDDFLDVCKRCGNEMCVCNIEKSLSIAGEKGTFQRNADQLRYIEEERKAHGQASDYRYLKAKSSVDDRKANNQQDDQWKKFRPSLEDSF
ncbi:uncharacterized protein [Parasteatoda tepidariorum]|uniref:uncharacterized protein isoform X4 n=1 Tax=Parasteatoda tepidariorum TaxID=114398 RepID=UPI0039BD2A8F